MQKCLRDHLIEDPGKPLVALIGLSYLLDGKYSRS